MDEERGEVTVDVFTQKTARLMAEDACRYYEDMIAERIEIVFKYDGRRPTKEDIVDAVDQIIERSDGLLPNDECFSAAMVSEIWNSDWIDSIGDALRDAEDMRRNPLRYMG